MHDNHSESELPLSPYPVGLSRTDLRWMLKLVRILYRLSRQPAYRDEVSNESPASADYDPGHAAVMMGYDFHLTEQGPRLIEVNTNAGGSYLALLNEDPRKREHFVERTLRTFRDDFRKFGGPAAALRNLAILDEDPENQFLYPEMQAFARAFAQHGIATHIVDPADLHADRQGVYLGDVPIDMVYNRHCDFYLESPAMTGIRDAYLAGSVCLSPNPFSYALLADKRRLPLWRDPLRLAGWGLSPGDIDFMQQTIPGCALLKVLDRDALWEERRGWVFKPVGLFGSRGVLLGEKITRSRYEQLDPDETLCQRHVPPHRIRTPDGHEFKVDLRLFIYRDRLLGITARLYRGQVTNMRTEGGGFAQVVVDRA